MTSGPLRIILSFATVLSGTALLAAPPLTVAAPGHAPIVNRVIDLLDQTIALNTAGVAQWESEPFDTSQFEWIGLHVSAASADGNVRCETAWRYSADDDAVLGPPSISTLTEINRGGAPLQVFFAPVSSVLGLEGRIVCRIELGGDPRGDPPQASGTIKNVKVLLRRF
jgi:hypothetical protein